MDFRVIKENDLFLLTADNGDIMPDALYGHGLYMKDTRFLSGLTLTINGEKPILLSSEADQNYISRIVLTNPHQEQDGELILWRESIELVRTRFIYNDVLYESIKATNYNPEKVKFQISLQLAADFHDMFIVRGFQNGDTGKPLPAEHTASSSSFRYAGADEINRSTIISWSEACLANEDGNLQFELELDPGASKEIDLFIAPQFKDEDVVITPKDAALSALRQSYENWLNECMDATSDHGVFNEMYQRSLLDLRALATDFGYGMFPVAGLPWFAVPFGRDSLITALQMLPVNPRLAKGTLYTMASFQGTDKDGWRDEQPGKIMHELRQGELANTKQIPFAPYYGTIDATPLFLILLGEYVERTGDRQTFMDMLPHVKRALEWVDEYGDRDGDSFVEYYQEASKGIANQGWKDSGNSVVHRSGEYGKAPIALAEVQGYVYQGKMAIAGLLRQYSETGSNEWLDWASKLEDEARELQHKFDAQFWMDSEQFYAIALDQDKKQVESVTSNPGHLLMSGMLQKTRADQVASRLLSVEMFSGYGIRTMAVGQMGYNPMSYHNGSVWPHDNSLCLIGLAKLGYEEQSRQLIEGLLLTAEHMEYNRLPELFCGYSSEEGRPVQYPVACSPQAWAAGTALVIAEAMAGIHINDKTNSLRFQPVLPGGMNELRISRYKLGQGSLDFTIRRMNSGYDVTIDANTTGLTAETNQAVNA